MDFFTFVPSILHFFKSEYTIALVLIGLLAAVAGFYFVKRWMSKEPIQSVPPEISAAVSSSLAPEGSLPSGESAADASEAPETSEA